MITTRRRDAALTAGRQVVDVGLFSAAEADEYLRAKLADQPELLPGADELAADLGRLPLALAQAAAYVLDRRLTCSGYRRRLRERRLADVAPNALPDDHAASSDSIS